MESFEIYMNSFGIIHTIYFNKILIKYNPSLNLKLNYGHRITHSNLYFPYC